MARTATSSRSAPNPRCRARCGSSHGILRELGHSRDAPQDREQPGEGVHVRWELRAARAIGQMHQMATQGVNDRIDGLVRNRLALVSASAEHERLTVLREPVEERSHEGGLAHAGSPADVHGHRASGARSLEGLAQRKQLSLATDEQRLAPAHSLDTRRRSEEGHARRRIAMRVQPAQDFRPVRTPRRFPVEKPDAERFEIGRDARGELGRGDRVDACLQSEHLGRGAFEWRVSDQRLVEHDADPVPVGRGRGLPTDGPLRGHVAWATHRVFALDKACVRDARKLRGDTEVEDHDAPFVRHENVRWLDVPMKFACRVQCLQPHHKLAQRRAQPVVRDRCAPHGSLSRVQRPGRRGRTPIGLDR